MRIRDVSFTLLRHTLPRRYGDAQGLKTHRAVLVIRIETDKGLTGWGDISDARNAVFPAQLQQMREALLRHDPLQAAPLVQRLASFGPRLAAGIDIALADLRGKAAGMNLAVLLGGAFRASQPCYASMQNAGEATDVVSAAVAEAGEAIRLGFRHIKMKVGWHNPDLDARWVEAVLEATPETATLALDANRVLDLAAAERLMHGIGRQDRITWLEEPCSSRYPLAYAELRQRLSVPIAGGESMDMAMLRQVVAGRMMDIVQPDLVSHGGFAAMQHLFALCDAHGVRLIPHCFDGQLTRVATLHLLAAQPDWEVKHCPYEAAPVEVDISPNPLRDELLVEGLRPDNEGRLAVPAGPGLGVTVNEDFIAKMGQPIAL